MEARSQFFQLFKYFLIGLGSLFFINIILLCFSYAKFPGFIPVLFQSVSLSTLTGYAPGNFYDVFSVTGQWIYTFLLQVNVFFYVYFLYLLFHMVLSTRQFSALPSLIIYKAVLGEALVFLLILEAGLLLPMLYVVNGTFQIEETIQVIHFSLTYVIGAIGNVKVDLLDANFINFDPRDLLLFKLLLASGVFIGKLGLPVIRDLIHPKVLRERLDNPNLDWKSYTRIVLFGLMILIPFLGMIIYQAEKDHLLSGLPLLDQVFSSLILPLNAGFGGTELYTMDQLSGITFWIVVLLTFIGGGIFAVTGGINISSVVFLFKKEYARFFLVYIMSLVLIQVGLLLIIHLIAPEATFKSNFSLLINSFFNGGWHEFDVASNGSLIFISVIMLCGRVITLFAPWYIFMIKSGKLPDEIRS